MRRSPDQGASRPGLARDALDLGLLLRRHIGDDQVLVGRDAEIAVVNLRDVAQGGLLRGAGDILHAAVLHEQRQMPAAVVALRPAILVAGRREREGLRRRELHAGAALDFGAEGIQAAVLDGVFEPRVLAVLAVAPVALHGDDGFGDLHRIGGRAETHDVGGARISVRLAMGHAHAAADGHVPAGDRRRHRRGWRCSRDRAQICRHRSTAAPPPRP